LPISIVRGASVGGSARRKQRLYARNQFARAERLRHVIVRAHLEAYHAVGLFSARGEHQNRQAIQRLIFPHFPANIQAGKFREH